MSQASPKLKRMRRLKHARTLAVRQGKTLAAGLGRNFTALVLALAQQGGEIVISNGTQEQVLPNITTLTWSFGKSPTEGEVVLRLVNQADAATPETL